MLHAVFGRLSGKGVDMSYAIDLSPRQSARTLEQAFRHRATVLIEPRCWNGETFAGRLTAPEMPPGVKATSMIVVLEPAEGYDPQHYAAQCPSYERLKSLVTSYCDAMIQMGDNRYLFSSDVIRVERGADGRPVRLHLSRPETIQVAQRRRFWRFRPARSSQVEIRWTRDDGTPGGAVGWLCNVSGDGLACRVDQRVGEQLWIGDRLTLEFALSPGDPQHYVLDATICSKTPAGTEDKMIIGVQFLTGDGHESSSRAADLLRQHLLAKHALRAGTHEGADA